MAYVCTLQEYRMRFADPRRYRVLTICLIVGYVLAGLRFLYGLRAGTDVLVDAALHLLLLTGIHWKKSKGCAVGLLVLGAASVALNILTRGSVCGWSWMLDSAVMVWTFRKIDQEYEAYKKSVSERFDRGSGYYRYQ